MRINSILLVDDDISSLYLLSYILESRTIKTTKATNGVEAAEILKNTNFDMIITDYTMPYMDGIELALIARELRPCIPIIMITAVISADVVEMAAMAGISQILSKPFNIEHLLGIIRNFRFKTGARYPSL
jgi:CheY-like chemotaxis protein